MEIYNEKKGKVKRTVKKLCPVAADSERTASGDESLHVSGLGEGRGSDVRISGGLYSDCTGAVFSEPLSDLW